MALNRQHTKQACILKKWNHSYKASPDLARGTQMRECLSPVKSRDPLMQVPNNCSMVDDDQLQREIPNSPKIGLLSLRTLTFGSRAQL